MEVYERLEEIAKGGYEKLSKEDSAYFLKCFGLFDKGEHFMLRVRVPIGQLNYEQAKRIGEVAREVWRGLYRYYYPVCRIRSLRNNIPKIWKNYRPQKVNKTPN